jgi:hypothetical protein
MTKTEILMDQIQTLATALPTESIEQIIVDLEVLHQNKLNEILSSIDLEELIILQEELLDIKFFEFEYTIKVDVGITADEYNTEPQIYFEQNTFSIHEFVKKQLLMENDKFKKFWDNKQKIITRFKNLIEKIADKHKINKSLVYEELFNR